MNERAEVRSRTMRAVKSENTSLEMSVRRLVHALGYRYRLHVKDLPGKPDLVFPSRRKVIFVHGCFWHQHACPRGARQPKANPGYWLAKLGRNQERDAQHCATLHAQGWNVLIVWECETKDEARLRKRLLDFLEPGT
jgi:DNA mismatch endonuclease, patch repair protein